MKFKKKYLCRPMKRKISIQILCWLSASIILFTSCRSEFEKIRTSNNAELIYQKALEYYEDESYQKAQTLFELAISGYRGKKEAEDISFKYAYTFYYLGSFIMASYHFKNFSRTFSTSSYREESDYMDAYSNYKLSPTFRLDQSYTQTAIDAFQIFINTYPDSERVPVATRLIDEMRMKLEVKTLETGKLYYNVRQYQAAVHTFENLLKDFPETQNAAYVRYLIVKSQFDLAANSVPQKRKERFEKAMETGNEFVDRYSKSEYRIEIQEIVSNAEKKIEEINQNKDNVRY